MNRRQAYEFMMKAINIISSLAIYLVAIFVFPFIGNKQNIDISNTLPAKDAGTVVWVLYILMIVAPMIINLSIFELLLFDGVNAGRDKEGSKYREAMELLSRSIKTKKEYIPISPEKWMTKTQLTKTIGLCMGSIASMFMITNIILDWNIQTFIAVLVTLTWGLIMAFVTRVQAIRYYSQDIYDYAVYINKEDQKTND